MQLQEQVGLIQNRVSSSEIAQLEAEIVRTKRAEQHFENVMAQAITQQDGQTAAEASRRKAQAAERANQLQAVRERIAQGAQAVQPLDVAVHRQATDWTERNKWFKPGSSDTDSQVATAIDRAVAQEGFDPRTPAYWQELDRRLARYLPHRVKAGSMPVTPREKPKSPVAGSGREAAPASGSKGFVLSPDRVKALKEAGSWDDPKLRSDAIRRFREYDKSAAQRTA